MDQLIGLTNQTTRRQFTIGSIVAGAALVLPRITVVAAAARQNADLAVTGLPTLDITVLNDGYEGVPETLEAGRYHVTVRINENNAFGGFGGVAFMQPPAGMSPDEFLAAFGIGPHLASPEQGGASPAAAGENGGGLPAVVHQAAYAGGTVIGPEGSPRSIVLDLTAGQWIAWADEPSAPQAPVIFTVTGAFPNEVAEPESDIAVTLVDFGINVDGNLVAGDHTLAIENQGAEPHFLLLDRYLGDLDLDNDFMTAALEAEMSGAAMPDGFDPETDLESVAISLTQSTGTTTWLEVSLVAGTYLATCFFPTAGTGVPHAMMGMHQVFTVTG